MFKIFTEKAAAGRTPRRKIFRLVGNTGGVELKCDAHDRPVSGGISRYGQWMKSYSGNGRSRRECGQKRDEDRGM